MPFKSEKQRKWMWANDPEMAEKWSKKESEENLDELDEEDIDESLPPLTNRQFSGKSYANDPTGGVTVSFESLLRNVIRNSLLSEQTDKKVEYDPSCAYEVRINKALESAGLRSEWNPPNKSTFCYGTDAGADAEFQNPEGKVYNLELKDGSGQARSDDYSQSVRDEGMILVSQIAERNTVEYLKTILERQRDLFKLKGLQSRGPISLTDSDIDGLASYIQQAQSEELNNLLKELSSGVWSGKRPKASLYYYFGRTSNASKDLKLPPSFPMSLDSSLDPGEWTKHYTASETYYIQVGGSGLFFMGQDPAGIGVPSFDSAADLSTRVRLQSSSGKSIIGEYILEDGTPVTISGRRYDFLASVDLKSSGGSSINLDTEDGIQKLKNSLGYKINESKIRDLIKEILLLEGGERGLIYEETIVGGINSLNIPGVRAEMQNSTKYDCDLYKDGSKAKVEIKLDERAQLGKVAKNHFSELKWTVGGNSLVYTLKDVGTNVGRGDGAYTIEDHHHEIAEYAVQQFQSNPGIVEKMNRLFIEWAGLSYGEVVDLKSTWESIRDPINGKDLPTEEDYPSSDNIRGGKGFSSGTDIQIPASMVQQMFQKVNYLIVGNNRELEASGKIGLTGADVLNLGVSPIQFKDSNLLVRWAGKGSGHSFVFETRGAGGVPGGNEFNSLEDLGAILSGAYSKLRPEEKDGEIMEKSEEKLIKKIIKESLLLEELNGSDKSEINQMIKKAIEKDRSQQKKIMRAEIESEIKASKISKIIKELAAEELKKGLKSKNVEKEMAEITKKVMKKLYRELSYSYTPLIDRLKV